MPQLNYSIAAEINKRKFKALNQGLTKNQIVISEGILLNIHPDDYFTFRYFTDLDAEMVQEMQSFIEVTQEKTCLLDIGSAQGIFSLVFTSRPNTVAFAIEPYYQAYEKICYHQKINPHSDIRPFQLAMGASDGKLNMGYEAGHLVAVPTSNLSIEEATSVDMVTVDSFVLEHNIVPDVIKIDIEGFELEALKGAVGSLSQYSPIIFLEVHPKHLLENNQNAIYLIDFINQLNYTIYDLRLQQIKNPSSYFKNRVQRIICLKK
ncbi:MAG: FkbM family methyltransferase [Coleofasciculus chthonoplastes F3-SA18-01]|uniref:FkbM family methyltransferase n=1 Tax=Coleofasciculus chthonoplastes TaxID=64178 RepID=UPI0032FD0C73